MTGMDGWHAWTVMDRILHIDYRLMDRRTWVLVKSLSRLKRLIYYLFPISLGEPTPGVFQELQMVETWIDPTWTLEEPWTHWYLVCNDVGRWQPARGEQVWGYLNELPFVRKPLVYLDKLDTRTSSRTGLSGIIFGFDKSDCLTQANLCVLL